MSMAALWDQTSPYRDESLRVKRMSSPRHAVSSAQAEPWHRATLTNRLSLCPPVNNNVTAVARLIQSHKDLLILSHVTENFPAVSLSGEWVLP